jgi:hypothetical protein
MLLFWEHLTTPFDTLGARVEVWASAPSMDSKQIRLTDDSTWGFYNDVESDDPATKYEVRIFSSLGDQTSYIPNHEIRRAAMRADQSLLTIERVRIDGQVERQFEVRLSTPHGGLIATYYGNSKGVAVVPLRQLATVRLRISDDPFQLEFVVPQIRDLTYEDVYDVSSALPADTRGVY